jgi:hypothetical protein
MARRIKRLVAHSGIKKDFCFTVGVAKNACVVKSAEEAVNVNVVNIHRDP